MSYAVAKPTRRDPNAIFACALRHTVTIQAISSSQDSFGQPIESWPPFATVRASIEPLRGRELFDAQQVNAETTTRIIIRYRSGIDASMRIIFGDIIYNIQSVIDVEMRHAWLELMCSSGLNLG